MGSKNAGWRSPDLGSRRELDLPQGLLDCYETGSGPPIVFVHGALVNANLWRKPIAALAGRARCVALDLPFGAHLRPMPAHADLSPPAFADLVADALEALELTDVTLVGNDTGGAICQLVATRRAERIGRLVLTPCDAFDNFPPRAIRPVLPLMRLPGALVVAFTPFRLRALRSRGLAVMGLAKQKLDPIEVADSYTYPALSSKGVRRDVKRAMREMDSRYTLEAAERLAKFDRPALIAWSTEDRFFPKKHAERLAEIIPDSRVEWIEDARTFSPEDQPERLAELIADFVREPERPRAV
jgi:pimeloyl-ACP methyl ester carboxylesterase